MSRFTPLSRALVCILIAAAASPPGFGQDRPKSDPMRPDRPQLPVRADGTVPSRFELTAVLISASRRVAVINGGLYREGDEIEGATITRIAPGSVSLRRGSEQLVVPLNAQEPATSDIHGDPAS